eukprot:m.88912 g.88912  ORF g.88912 m.88912 type:complete len:73 (-) comp51027_c0_seq15:10-228(-)
MLRPARRNFALHVLGTEQNALVGPAKHQDRKTVSVPLSLGKPSSVHLATSRLGILERPLATGAPKERQEPLL